MATLTFVLGTVFGLLTGAVATLAWLVLVAAQIGKRKQPSKPKVVVIPHEATKEMH